MTVRRWTVEGKGTVEIRAYPHGVMLEITEPFDKYESTADVVFDPDQLAALSDAVQAAVRWYAPCTCEHPDYGHVCERHD